MIKLRPDAAHDLANAIALINEPLQRCCWSCTYVDTLNNKCKKYNVTPPIKVITFGCSDWEQDEIPF